LAVDVEAMLGDILDDIEARQRLETPAIDKADLKSLTAGLGGIKLV
jgi:hypothetical protein